MKTKEVGAGSLIHCQPFSPVGDNRRYSGVRLVRVPVDRGHAWILSSFHVRSVLVSSIYIAGNTNTL
jgi:hypothetical protein